MAEHETTWGDHPRTTVRVRPGERVTLCRCFQSHNFPFCDGSHRQVEGRGPVTVIVLADEPGSPIERA